MLISHSHHFIFIHTAKVAGISIRSALEQYTEEPEFFKIPRPPYEIAGKPNPLYQIWQSSLTHVKAEEIQKNLPEEYNKYFTFAFVRNPWDWQVSMYHFLLKEKDNPRYDLIANMQNFEEYLHWVIEEPRPYPKRATKLQSEMILNQQGEIIVDFVGRFEKLNEDFTHICEHIGIHATLPQLNRSSHQNYRQYYNKEMIQLVEKYFAEDIKRFNYEF